MIISKTTQIPGRRVHWLVYVLLLIVMAILF